LFQTLSLGIFFFSSKRKKKQRKKTIEKNRNVEKGGRFPSSSYYVLSLSNPASALPFLPFCFKRFLLASSSQAEENKIKTKKNKTIRKKNAKKGGSLFSSSRSTFFHFWFLVLDSCFYLFISSTFFVASS
jgi:hypothetical protein